MLKLGVSAHAAAHGAANASALQPEHAAGSVRLPAIARQVLPSSAGPWRAAHTSVMNMRACSVATAVLEHVDEQSVMPGSVSRTVHAAWPHGQPVCVTAQQSYADDVRSAHVVSTLAMTSMHAMGTLA